MSHGDCRDTAIKTELVKQGLNVESHNGSLLWEPWDVTKADGTALSSIHPVFSSRLFGRSPPRMPLPAPDQLELVSLAYKQDGIDGLNLLPDIGWDTTFDPHWQIGEAGAKQRLVTFIDQELSGYKEGRNFPPAFTCISLVPSFALGEILPNTVWYAADRIEAGLVPHEDGDHFLSELGWREFSYSLLYNFPDLPRQNFNSVDLIISLGNRTKQL